ncbi:uncharacterized protein RAG0_14298 [Rhynchosporium agropyri]|uniref:Uncharacterized protein n=1 Tax=Rhynchosporium agropyri TaxID=914238 RepID=A0A1E1LGN4_9HELO|nr:uncharacterized protein RAG0_14298 [Rhynchosporium agropyri]
MAAESNLTISIFLKTTTIGTIAWTPSKKKPLSLKTSSVARIMMEESGQLLEPLLSSEDEPPCEVVGNFKAHVPSIVLRRRRMNSVGSDVERPGSSRVNLLM